MGEIADLMVNGSMCESCSEWLLKDGEEPPGYPRNCAECAAPNN